MGRGGIESQSTITILPGKLKIVEDGVGWFEEILTQSKNGLSCEIETQAGRYLLVFEGECLKRAYLRSFVGADRIYRNED